MRVEFSFIPFLIDNFYAVACINFFYCVYKQKIFRRCRATFLPLALAHLIPEEGGGGLREKSKCANIGKNFMPLWTQKMLYLSEFKADKSRLNYRTIDSTVNGGGGVRRGGELKWMRLVYAADPLSPINIGRIKISSQNTGFGLRNLVHL